MQNKFNKNNDFKANFIFGIHQISKDDIEFYGINESKTVRFIKNGHCYPFNELPKKVFIALSYQYQKDPIAKRFLTAEDCNFVRQVELYTYYCYGSLDHQADWKDGRLTEPENFRHSADCPSLNFTTKKINIGDAIISRRELQIIDMIALDYKDEAIASEIGVAESTLNGIKRKLFKKIGVQTKVAALKVSMQHGIVI